MSVYKGAGIMTPTSSATPLSPGSELRSPTAAAIAAVKSRRPAEVMCHEESESASGLHIGALPVEVLVRIWSYLTWRDYPAVAQTCQAWAAVTSAYLPRDLRLARQPFVDDRCLNFIATSLQPISLDLSASSKHPTGCTGVSEASIRNLLTNCPSLKSLKLSHLRLSSLTTWHLSAYAKRLDSLDLSHSDLGSSVVDWACAPTLRSVNLHRTTYPNRMGPIWDWSTFTSLAKVEIAASDIALRGLAQLPTLMDVTFHGGDIRVTDEVLATFRNLHRLALRNVSVYSNYPIRPQWAALKDVLGAAKELLALEINAPRPAPLVDNTLREWIVACPKVTALRLVCNSKKSTNTVTDNGLRAVAQFCGPRLQEFRLFYGDITDVGVTQLLQSCPTLRVLHVPFSEQLTEVSLGLLPELCPNLRELNLNGCRNVSRSCIDTLGHLLPDLARVQAYGLHHALSNYHDGPETPAPLDRPLVLRRLPRSMSAWVTLEGAGALNTTTIGLLRRNVKLDYWPPPAASHKMPAVCFRRSLVRAPVPPSLGGREHMCDCSGVVCVHGCGAVVPRCLEEDHTTVCPRAPVPCALAGLGCHVVVARHELWAHVENCIHNQLICTLCQKFFPRPALAEHMATHSIDATVAVHQGCPLRNEGCTARCDLPDVHFTRECRYYIMRCSMCTAVVLRSQLHLHSCDLRPLPLPNRAPVLTLPPVPPVNKYIRRSPGSSPQLSRERRVSGSRRSSSQPQLVPGRWVVHPQSAHIRQMVAQWDAQGLSPPSKPPRTVLSPVTESLDD